MRFEVYCDESRPDLLASRAPRAKYMVIGSLWLRADDRERFKNEIHALRDRYRIGSEFKWQKVSPSRLEFYRELVDWFVHKNLDLRFRCVAVEHEKVNLLRYHENDQELGFYKFYYQMLHHWILDCNEYTVFCDFKSNRKRDRLHVLQRCLSWTNLSSTISAVQAVRSRESVLIQLADVLTGAAEARLNDTLTPGGCKERVVKGLEESLQRKLCGTLKSEQKFNVFVMNLDGGW